MQLAERLRNNDHLFSTDIKGKQGVCSPMLIELLTACIFGCVLTAVCVCVCVWVHMHIRKTFPNKPESGKKCRDR